MIKIIEINVCHITLLFIFNLSRSLKLYGLLWLSGKFYSKINLTLSRELPQHLEVSICSEICVDKSHVGNKISRTALQVIHHDPSRQSPLKLSVFAIASFYPPGVKTFSRRYVSLLGQKINNILMCANTRTHIHSHTRIHLDTRVL